jgi:hypothetical protein
VGIDHREADWPDVHLIHEGHCATIEGLIVVLVWYAATSLRFSLQATLPNMFLFGLVDVEC